MHNYIFVFFFKVFFNIVVFSPCMYKKRLRQKQTDGQTDRAVQQSPSRETDGREWGRGRGDAIKATR